MTVIPVIGKDRLVTLIQDPATTRQTWTDTAACRTLVGDPFFPNDDRVPSADVLAQCPVCPVAGECLATALVHEASEDHRHGWWGGIGPVERDALWAQLGAPATPPPGDIDLRDPIAVARYLRDQHQTVAAIAAELGCSERTVYRYLAAHAA